MRRLPRFPLLAAALAVAALAVASPAPAADDARALWRQNRRLAAEATLSASPKPYFLLDLEGRRIALMARGLVLFEVPIVQSGVWGPGLVIGPSAVVQRDALSRPAIKPGEEKTTETLEDQILELADMPTTYRLHLAGDVTIEVLPLASGRWPVWRQRLELWRWRLTRPLVTLRERRARHETTSAYVVLAPVDAQRLYWSFFEGLDGIVIPPAGR
jgi:hypothetical protein